jgi:hypothetical protein
MQSKDNIDLTFFFYFCEFWLRPLGYRWFLNMKIRKYIQNVTFV